MPDPLQGKSTPENIAIESLLNMCDSTETEDSLLDENAQLMPVDRPPDIPIEAKGIMPTEPVNSESQPAAERALKIPAPNKEADTDETEVLKNKDKVQKIKHCRKALNQQNHLKLKTRRKSKNERKQKQRSPNLKKTEDKSDETKSSNTPKKKGKLITETFVL